MGPRPTPCGNAGFTGAVRAWRGLGHGLHADARGDGLSVSAFSDGSAYSIPSSRRMPGRLRMYGVDVRKAVRSRVHDTSLKR